MTRVLGLLLPLVLVVDAAAEEMLFGAVEAHRLEWQFDKEQLFFDIEGNYGSDEHQFVTKLEGEKPDSRDTEYSAQFLYSKPVSPFFDLLLGVEVLGEGSEATAGIAAGFEGMAPYRIELDAHATLTENGDVLVHGEFEREFLLTQKLVLVPRIDVSAALTDVDGIDAGFTELSVDLRAHYEITRKFAPYVGLSWQRVFGDRARLLEAAGESNNDVVALLGASFWF
tara:strand:+ start:303 stop:980 length:678 start_codon:yes stop_codon:yes gene_type:complete